MGSHACFATTTSAVDFSYEDTHMIGNLPLVGDTVKLVAGGTNIMLGAFAL